MYIFFQSSFPIESTLISIELYSHSVLYLKVNSIFTFRWDQYSSFCDLFHRWWYYIGLYMTIIVVLYKDRVWAWFEKTMIFLIKADGCLLSDFRLWDLRDYFLKCLKLLRKEKKNWKTFSSSGLLQSLVNYSVGYGVQ